MGEHNKACFEMQKQICVKVQKASVAVAGAAMNKRVVIPKTGEKKAIVKLKPDEVIVRSLDIEEKVNARKQEKAPINKNKDTEGSSKKISYTSILTARNKVTFNILSPLFFWVNLCGIPSVN